MLALFRQLEVKALSHITGGGLPENLPRVLPAGCRAVVDTSSWQWPEIFHWLQTQGNVATSEMYRTFNCGVGMVLCVSEESAAPALRALADSGLLAWRLGHVTAGEQGVELA